MSSIVYHFKNEGLAVGLSWSVLTSEADRGKHLRAKVRAQASLLNATRYVVNTLLTAGYLGLYSPPVLEAKAPKRVFSLAMVFLEAFKDIDKNTINAILLMPSSSDSQRCALIVIEGGQVVHDRLEKTAEAIAQVQKYRGVPGMTYSVFSDTREIPDCSVLTWEQLLGYRTNLTEMAAIPRNTALILTLAILAIAAIGYATYHYTVLAPARARAALLAQEAQQNQTPQYLQKLNVELMRVGWEKANLKAMLSQLAEQKSYVKGWVLDQITCDFDKQNCEYRFTRLGGEVAELISIESDKKYDSATSTKDMALFSKTIKLEAKSLTREVLPEFEAGTVDLRTRLQRLTNAGAGVNTTGPTPWPTNGLDMSKVDKKVIVKRAAAEIKVALPLSESVLGELPEYLVLRNFSIAVATVGDKANLLTLTLKGHSYAK